MWTQKREFSLYIVINKNKKTDVYIKMEKLYLCIYNKIPILPFKI